MNYFFPYRLPRPFQEDLEKHILENLPEHVSIKSVVLSFFPPDKEAILAEAAEEGYALISRIPNDATLDAYVVVSGNEVAFYRRLFFKGKPSKEFRLSRDGDRPARFTDKSIEFFKNGELHRENNKPAYITFDELTWNVNGKWHRSDEGHTVVNTYRGLKKHKDHDLYWRETIVGGKRIAQRFVGFHNGVAQWENE